MTKNRITTVLSATTLAVALACAFLFVGGSTATEGSHSAKDTALAGIERDGDIPLPVRAA